MPSTERQYGDLWLQYTTKFSFRWNDQGSGAKADGGFWHPIAPNGYFPLGSIALGSYGDPNKNVAALCVKEAKPGALAKPRDYNLIWQDKGSGAKKDGACWEPVPPPGYVALGSVFNSGYNKPSVDDIRCVRIDLTDVGAGGPQIWTDKGSGAPMDLSCWAIDCPIDTTDDTYMLIGPTTFVGVRSYSKPTGPNYRCLNLLIPATTGKPPEPPRLTSTQEPPARTTEVVVQSIVVPFVSIADPGKTIEWQVANSPFYTIQRLQFYSLVLFINNAENSEQTRDKAVTSGVERSQTNTFSVNTGISVTAEAGVSFLGNGGKASATVSLELGFSQSTGVSEFSSILTTRRLTAPPQTAAALWVVSKGLRLVRQDGSIVGTALVFNSQAFYQAQFPTESGAVGEWLDEELAREVGALGD